MVEVVKQVGTVDYTNGTVTVSSIVVDQAISPNGLEFFVASKDKDFSSTKNKILKIKEDAITITVTPVKL